MSLLGYSYEDYSAHSYGSQAQWRALQIFSAYRVFIALNFVMIYWFNISFINDSDKVPELSLFLTLFYCVYSFAIGYINYRESMSLQGTTYTQQLVDMIVMILLMSNNVAMEAPLGVLICINIAAMSLLCPSRVTFFFAAIVTIMLFALVIIRGQATQFDGGEFLAVAMHGTSYFVIAAFGHLLVKRLQSNRAFADQQQYDLRSLEQLNERIIERLHSGIIVVDYQGSIRLMNTAARRALGIAEQKTDESLSEISPELSWQLIHWQEDPTTILKPMPSHKVTSVWMPTFISLSAQMRSATLIFLEDKVATAQQAQQMKLASLGRFTASIAHELRNPLGAISHAVQLLLEKQNFTQQEQRLLEIIHSQTDRLNGVIKNILNLTRRQQAAPTTILLSHWLPGYLENYQAEQYEHCEIEMRLDDENLSVKMDPTQLDQVLTNLLDNGLRASKQKHGARTAVIHAYLDYVTQLVTIDVMDHGPGLSVEAREKIFEPFFTEHRSGHGLGLYICAELCLANQARLEAVEEVAEGACFRIRFHGCGGE